MPGAPKYIAVDLETTGLDPAKDRILEIAIVVLDGELQSLGAYQTVVQAPREALENARSVPRDMHLKTGLLVRDSDGALALSGNPVPLHEVEQYLIGIAQTFEKKPILLGQSVHFDRGFLRHWMPAFESLLSHRHVDASTIRRIAPDEVNPPFEGIPHRALSDIQHSIAIVRQARDILRGAGAAGSGDQA